MPKKKSTDKIVALSASRIKKAIDCSWQYYCNYVLKLPDESNDGAKRGSVVHLVLELLLKDKRRDLVKTLIENEDPFSSPSVKRLAFKHAKLLGVDDDENFQMIKDFILVGLNSDFYCEGNGEEKVELFPPEKKFDLTNEEPVYRVLGFIDKIAFYPKSGIIRVVDYKTSKQKFSKEELDFNIQALTYSLAARKLFKGVKRVVVEFLFLKFKKNPSLKCEFSVEDLEMFEGYLGEMSELLSSFDEEKAKHNYAYDAGFSKKWLCGKVKGDLNKAGQPAYICKCKYPFDYYEASKGGSILRCAMEKSILVSEFEGQKGVSIKKKHYGGCPRFKGILF